MRVVVAGLGDVGGRAAALLAADGHEVVGIRRSASDGPPGVRMLRGDLHDPTLASQLPAPVDAVLVTVTPDARDPDAYRAAYVDGPTTLLTALRDRGDAVRRVVFTSSTAVYGQRDGEWVDESSPTEPTSATAPVLLAAEAAIAAVGFPTTALRLTGIYGPGRDREVRTVREGRAVVTSTPVFTNRIHAADAATACVHLLGLGADAPDVVIGTDDEPVPHAEVYAWLAAQLGVPGPTVDDDAARRTASKRCRNELLRSLGWAPAYPGYREGYAELVRDTDPTT